MRSARLWLLGAMVAMALSVAGRADDVGETFRDCPECPEMVVLPLGSYQMGSPPHEEGREDNEGPVHEVTIAAPFAIGRYEVTVKEFARFVDETGHQTGNFCMDLATRAMSFDPDATAEEKKQRLQGLENNVSWRNPSFAGFPQLKYEAPTDGYGGHPVVCVSWSDAQAYAAWLAQETGEEYRLPSESEWEYAARAGNAAARHWGEDPVHYCGNVNGMDESFFENTHYRQELFNIARAQMVKEFRAEMVEGLKEEGLEAEDVDRWMDQNRKRVVAKVDQWMDQSGVAIIQREIASCQDGAVVTAPVGATEFAANGWGFKHMLGNVDEWTQDCWNEGYAGAPSDGSAWEVDDKDEGLLGWLWDDAKCDERVVRGGSWATLPNYIRAAARGHALPAHRDQELGFRVARTLAPATAMAHGKTDAETKPTALGVSEGDPVPADVRDPG